MNFLKKTIYYLVVMLFTGIGYSQTVDSLYEVATWQGFKKGAVSFTFDDNCANQLSVVMPMFDQYGFKMTFFTVINWGPNWTALQAAALNGHEIGSHTMSHANLSTLTDDQQIAELENSQNAINSHIPNQKCLTIAYPNCVVGNSSICSQYYIAARGCSGVIVPKTPPDFMNISSIICGSQGSIQRTSDFTDKINATSSSNGWVVFLIHAIDNEPGYSPTSSTELEGALDYLSQNKDKFWEATFGNVVRYINERNNVSVKQVSVEDTLITFDVTDTLDNSIYNYPVTIRRILPQEWSSAIVSQNGKEISSKIVIVNEKDYIMFDVVPDSGTIQMTKVNVIDVSKRSESEMLSPYLMQNYPNPFNPVTTINYQISKNGFVTLKVYDLLGRELATLINKPLIPGRYSAKFNGNDFPSGIYLYKLSTGNFTSVKKLIVLK